MIVADFLAKLDAHGGKPRRRGSGYIACCPAHDDRSPSLSVAAGDDDRILIKCFAGCSTDDVLRAMDLRPVDLFPPRPETTRNVGRYGAFVDAAKRLRPHPHPRDDRPSVPAAGRDYRVDARRFYADAGHHRQRLAEVLGVDVEAVATLGGGHANIDGKGPCWTWPTWRPELGKPSVCGIKLRRERPAEGRSPHDLLAGHKAGIVLDAATVRMLDAGHVAEEDRPGLLILAEGPSDAAALLTMLDGHERVIVAGRPSCSSGDGYVRLLLDALKPGRVLIVGDRDESGRNGARKAGATVAACGFRATVAFPPDPHGDARAWQNAGATAGDLLNLDRGAA